MIVLKYALMKVSCPPAENRADPDAAVERRKLPFGYRPSSQWITRVSDCATVESATASPNKKRRPSVATSQAHCSGAPWRGGGRADPAQYHRRHQSRRCAASVEVRF